ncbi:MAG: hypothetical protein ACLGGX_08180 [Bdellovibrionia bacterium]
MKRISFVLTCLLLFSSVSALAQSFGGGREVALGFILGDPTGISGRFELNSRNSLSSALASTSGLEHPHFHLDYLWMDQKRIETAFEPLGVYWGVGGRIQEREKKDKKDETTLGVRLPIGLLMKLDSPRSEVLAEAAPVINIAPDIDVDFDIVIGFRVRF